MAKASDNQFPSVLFTEGAVPANPAAGDQRIYIDTADKKLKRVNSTGTVVDIEAIPNASVLPYTPAVATDWDSDADPGDVDNALDQLAERVDDVEPYALAQRATINFCFGKIGGSPIAANEQLWVEIPWAATVVAARMFSNESTTTVIDLWAEDYANYPPTDADTITSVTPPTITAEFHSEDVTLTNWLTLAAGDVLLANVDSNDNAEQVTLAVTIVRTA